MRHTPVWRVQATEDRCVCAPSRERVDKFACMHSQAGLLTSQPAQILAGKPLFYHPGFEDPQKFARMHSRARLITSRHAQILAGKPPFYYPGFVDTSERGRNGRLVHCGERGEQRASRPRNRRGL